MAVKGKARLAAEAADTPAINLVKYLEEDLKETYFSPAIQRLNMGIDRYFNVIEEDQASDKLLDQDDIDSLDEDLIALGNDLQGLTDLVKKKIAARNI